MSGDVPKVVAALRGSDKSEPILPRSEGDGTRDDTESLSTMTESHLDESTLSSMTHSVAAADTVQGSDASASVVDKLHFTSLPQLYGRDEQLKELEAAFERSKTSRGLVLIKGKAGVGKTALASRIDHTVNRADGFFISGKFDQQKQDQPYQAISLACQQLVHDILTRREEERILLQEAERNKTHADDVLLTLNEEEAGPPSSFSPKEFLVSFHDSFEEEDRALLKTVIPNLELWSQEMESGDDEKDKRDETETVDDTMSRDINYGETIQRFLITFKRFIRFVISFGPLVLVCDDLQWSSKTSLTLLEQLLTDFESPSLLIVGLYRENEIKEGDALSKFIDGLREESTLTIAEISLSNLSERDVRSLLSDLLLSDKEQIAGLAELIEAKTEGNAFFIKQFLLSLKSDGLLKYSFATMSWEYDLDEIRANTSATDNVVDLLKSKMQRLPSTLQTILPRIACLGSKFLASMFELVALQLEAESASKSSSKDDKTALLKLCKTEGLVVDCGKGWYKWEHDKIQEAALLSVDEDKRRSIQFSVGEMLLQSLTDDEVEQALFVVTNLLNSGSGTLAKDDPRRRKIAEMNLRSGQAAFASSAFSDATSYIVKGVEMLPAGMAKWEPAFSQLSLDLYSIGAEADFCAGCFDEMKQYCDEVLALDSVPLLSKRRIYNVAIHSLGAKGGVEAKDMCLEVLKKLDCKFPAKGKGLFAVAGVIRTTSTLKSSIETLEQLPVAKSEEKQWAFYLLDRLNTYSFQCDPNLFPLSILKGHRWTVKYGRSEMTGPLLAAIALMLSASLGDFEGGRAYAQLAEKTMTRSVEARVLFLAYYFCLHWVRPYKDLKPKLLRAVTVGLRSGDYESAFWCSYCSIEMSFYESHNLNELVEECKARAHQMEQLSQPKIARFVRMMWQLYSNLINVNSKRHVLEGEAMNEAELLQGDGIDPQTIHVVHLFRLIAHFWFGEYDDMVKIIEETDTHQFSYEKKLPGAVAIGPLYYYCCVACVDVAIRTKKSKCKKYAQGFYGRVKGWTKKGNPNLIHYEAMMEAELCKLSGQVFDAASKYDIAILLAEERGLKGDLAFFHERYAKFLESTRGPEDMEVKTHYNQANLLFSDWGAMTRVSMLPQSSNDFSAPLPEVGFSHIEASELF